ncbi:hypothetical protein SAMN05421753_12043 [Planctomicrobium piriforme]|uniref:Uncharacterized protein n=1 Tax=Planctomicrobium piriforme TaxID=1576369 RepID=A0A1I3R982_9PLAN|nr:hypothetical protein SAMN05421753_12043 [Planctomicrobium piriforme]
MVKVGRSGLSQDRPKMRAFRVLDLDGELGMRTCIQSFNNRGTWHRNSETCSV